jgi:pimeloyl-ACP methyl ester carboxylesterase
MTPGSTEPSSSSGAEPTAARLHTLAVGERGPRVAFLHGLFGQGRNWMQVAKSLAATDEGVRALLVDLPDHGRSPWTEEFSYERYADLVAAELEAVGGDDPWTVVGHSLGGKVAMVLALAHPGLVERLVVVDIAPKGYGDLSRFEGYIRGMQQLPLDEIDDRRDAEERFAEVEPDPGVRSFLLQNLRRDGDGWRWQANLGLFAADADAGSGSAIADFPDPGGTDPFPGPVLWLVGGESGYVRDADDEAMRALFPRTRQVTVKGADHWVHSQAPEVTTEALRRFLARPA